MYVALTASTIADGRAFGSAHSGLRRREGKLQSSGTGNALKKKTGKYLRPIGKEKEKRRGCGQSRLPGPEPGRNEQDRRRGH